MAQITYEDFDRVEIRVGRIVKVEDFPNARKPAYKIWVDFGEFGIKKSSAQLTTLYKAHDLVGKQVLAVMNFAPRQVADFMSEVLILGVSDYDEAVVLVQPDRTVPLGRRLF
jgi:tRNA-binding protein